jgi:hypothetical protein
MGRCESDLHAPRLKMKFEILYENGDYYVRSERFGNSQSSGFAVYKTGITCARRVSSIGFSGEKGFQFAKKDCDRRAAIKENPQS